MTAPATRLADLCLSEERPHDFAAKIGHGRALHTRTVRMRGRNRARLALLLAGAVALPAFAAPGGWDAFSIGDAVSSAPAVDPMPFERSGDSFPGSAFYYLQLEAGLGDRIHSDAKAAPGFVMAPPPPARALRVEASGIDRTRAEQCLTATIYYESASEADAGQRAVAQVVLNRVAHPGLSQMICGVVYQGSERSTGRQFSSTCDGSLSRRPNRLFWDRAAFVARQALSGYVFAPVGLATHYHTLAVNPYWAPSLHYLNTIGATRFYSFNGIAGRPGAFRFAYLGGEPVAIPHRRDRSFTSPTAGTALDSLAIQRAFDERLTQATPQLPGAQARSATSSPAPVYAGAISERGGDALYRAGNLPDATDVRPEYRDSGRWIATPTS